MISWRRARDFGEGSLGKDRAPLLNLAYSSSLVTRHLSCHRAYGREFSVNDDD